MNYQTMPMQKQTTAIRAHSSRQNGHNTMVRTNGKLSQNPKHHYHATPTQRINTFVNAGGYHRFGPVHQRKSLFQSVSPIDNYMSYPNQSNQKLISFINTEQYYQPSPSNQTVDIFQGNVNTINRYFKQTKQIHHPTILIGFGQYNHISLPYSMGKVSQQSTQRNDYLTSIKQMNTSVNMGMNHRLGFVHQRKSCVQRVSPVNNYINYHSQSKIISFVNINQGNNHQRNYPKGTMHLYQSNVSQLIHYSNQTKPMQKSPTPIHSNQYHRGNGVHLGRTDTNFKRNYNVTPSTTFKMMTDNVGGYNHFGFGPKRYPQWERVSPVTNNPNYQVHPNNHISMHHKNHVNKHPGNRINTRAWVRPKNR